MTAFLADLRKGRVNSTFVRQRIRIHGTRKFIPILKKADVVAGAGPSLEIVMPSNAHRQLELLKLSHPLQRYARTLQPDVNASLLLVHRALSRAFAERGGGVRPSAGLEASLRADMDRQMGVADART
jgi:hypothetical protein